jgi:hypothetical protein
LCVCVSLHDLLHVTWDVCINHVSKIKESTRVPQFTDNKQSLHFGLDMATNRKESQVLNYVIRVFVNWNKVV